MTTLREPETTVETWRKVWRDGFVPQLSTAGLQALWRALTDDSPKIIQGATVKPPPLSFSEDWPVECACPVAFDGPRHHVRRPGHQLDSDTVRKARRAAGQERSESGGLLA